MNSPKYNKEKELLHNIEKEPLHSANLEVQSTYVSYLLNASIEFITNKFTDEDEVELESLLNIIYSAHLNSAYMALQSVAEAAGDTNALENIKHFFSCLQGISKIGAAQ